jgi:hypothetical protein
MRYNVQGTRHKEDPRSKTKEERQGKEKKYIIFAFEWR